MWETWVLSLGWEDSPGEGNGYPLQYFCPENSIDRRAWLATVHGATKSQTKLSNTFFILSNNKYPKVIYSLLPFIPLLVIVHIFVPMSRNYFLWFTPTSLIHTLFSFFYTFYWPVTYIQENIYVHIYFICIYMYIHIYVYINTGNTHIPIT